MKYSQLQDVKARLSEFVSRVSEDGPMVITVHGRPKAVLVSMDVYERLYPEAAEPLLEFFRRSPLRGAGLELGRDPSPMRKVEL